MVILIRLADPTLIAPGVESMGRSWYGYDPSSTDEDVWEQNRGRYRFKTQAIEAERFAVLAYDAVVVVVAALVDGQNWEPFMDFEQGVEKKALIGTVLGPGDPAYDALHGQRVPRNRTPFEYLPDAEWGTADLAAVPGPAKTQGAGQGRQIDPVLRKQVEDAAQDRLMALYPEADGWKVTDTRTNRPYDAMARRRGEVVYLEAKGTQTAGDSVEVTISEIEHARRHPGQCVMGVLSDIRLDADGQVDPDSGVFRVLPFEPEDDALEVTGYRWRLPGK
jgi:hypothetical protein